MKLIIRFLFAIIFMVAGFTTISYSQTEDRSECFTRESGFHGCPATSTAPSNGSEGDNGAGAPFVNRAIPCVKGQECSFVGYQDDSNRGSLNPHTFVPGSVNSSGTSGTGTVRTGE